MRGGGFALLISVLLVALLIWGLYSLAINSKEQLELRLLRLKADLAAAEAQAETAKADRVRAEEERIEAEGERELAKGQAEIFRAAARTIDRTSAVVVFYSALTPLAILAAFLTMGALGAVVGCSLLLGITGVVTWKAREAGMRIEMVDKVE